MGENRKLETQDRRIKRTHRLLAKALIDLTLEKGYEVVTIRDIAERADIGYATFFRHYQDKEALLKEVLELVLAELLELLHPSRLPQAEPAAVGKLIFQYVQEHQQVVQVLVSRRGSSSLIQHMLEIGTRNVLESQEPRPEMAGSVPPEIAAYHIVASTISLIQWWLDHQLPYSVDRMGLIYQDLIIQPTTRLAFQLQDEKLGSVT